MRTDTGRGANQTSREKLIKLRLKTNRDLKSLLEKGLKRAFQLLGGGDREKAESAYAQALTLLHLMRAVPVEERQRLEQSIGELRAELDQAAQWGWVVRLLAGSKFGTAGAVKPHCLRAPH